MLSEISKAISGRNKVILVHGNADMDAIGSAYAVSKCFPPADIYAPGGMDRVSRIVTEKLNIPVLDTCDLSDYELVVVVDTSSPEQFKPGSAEIPPNSVIIDHHMPTGKWNGMQYFCDSSRVSCCEIIKDLIDNENTEMPRDVALALLGGMLTDSGHFQFANPALLREFADILEKKGIDMDEAMDLTRAPMNMSERIAVIKTAGRSKFDRVSDMIVATSTGSSFESSACRGLLSAGADVAFVCSQRGDEFRLSARATQEMVRRGISLGSILGDLSAETDTDGGGHSGAAGLSGIGDADAILHMCMMKTMDAFRKIKADMSQDDAGQE